MRDHTGERLTSRRALKAMTTLFAAVALLFVSVLPAWAAASMTLTFVRHAESDGNVAGAGIDTKVPGPNLTNPTGLQQAADIAQVLAGNPVNYHGIYVSDMVRTSQTAAPLFQTAKYQGQSATVLPGVREISAGIFEGSPVDSGLGRIGYFLIPLTWTLGLRSIPIPGGENGNGFEARVNESIATIEANGDTTPLVFSHGATIMIWTMMNVKNPDLGLLLSDPLPNTGVVVVTGNLEDGWTLVSYDGKAVDPNPGLVTQLFVNTRDLIATPQTALSREQMIRGARDSRSGMATTASISIRKVRLRGKTQSYLRKMGLWSSQGKKIQIKAAGEKRKSLPPEPTNILKKF